MSVTIARIFSRSVIAAGRYVRQATGATIKMRRARCQPSKGRKENAPQCAILFAFFCEKGGRPRSLHGGVFSTRIHIEAEPHGPTHPHLGRHHQARRRRHRQRGQHLAPRRRRCRRRHPPRRRPRPPRSLPQTEWLPNRRCQAHPRLPPSGQMDLPRRRPRLGRRRRTTKTRNSPPATAAVLHWPPSTRSARLRSPPSAPASTAFPPTAPPASPSTPSKPTSTPAESNW